MVGAGVIGLASAWRLAQAGMAVALVDPDPGGGASWAAAGMLAPVTEAHYGEEALLALNLAGAARWERFAAELAEAAGRSIGYHRCGTLLVTLDAGDRAWAEELFRYQGELGLDVSWLRGRQAREMVPALAPGVGAGLWAPGDHQVDNRLLLDALVDAVAGAGVELRRQAVDAVELSGGVVAGVVLDNGEAVAAATVVLATGSTMAQMGGLPTGAVPSLRPVKGQILRLSPSPRAPGMGCSVRGMVEGSSVYLVPRRDGSLVVGATVEELGFDTEVTAGAVYELLRDARRLVPGVSEMGLGEATARLRPCSADNGPVVGACGPVPGLVVAGGHYRNGILLAPITAEAVAAVVGGAEGPPEIATFGPDRFTGVAC
ncbi:MAG TPA: glycine oxidase ThiO [Acidimicrobiales bacterium]|nr:glycine oxidase ThiO [Acidimicrobiales bacterium]